MSQKPLPSHSGLHRKPHREGPRAPQKWAPGTQTDAWTGTPTAALPAAAKDRRDARLRGEWTQPWCAPRSTGRRGPCIQGTAGGLRKRHAQCEMLAWQETARAGRRTDRKGVLGCLGSGCGGRAARRASRCHPKTRRAQGPGEGEGERWAPQSWPVQGGPDHGRPPRKRDVWMQRRGHGAQPRTARPSQGRGREGAPASTPTSEFRPRNCERSCVHGFEPPRRGHRRGGHRGGGRTRHRGDNRRHLSSARRWQLRLRADSDPGGSRPCLSLPVNKRHVHGQTCAQGGGRQATRGRCPRAPTNHADSSLLSPKGPAPARASVLGPVGARSSPSLLWAPAGVPPAWMARGS